MGATSARDIEPSDIPGVVFVQLDGVLVPLLENEIRAGNIPTISLWVLGQPQLRPAGPRVPSTTPGPGRAAARRHTGSRPFAGARQGEGPPARGQPALVRRRHRGRVGNGRGLLADGGVSISNLFSGDAPIRLLTVSDARAGGE